MKLHPLISVSRRWALGLCVAAALPAWAAGEPIVIGQVAPLTGPQGVTGRAINAGAKLYFDSINAKGGVRGRPVTLVTRDDELAEEGGPCSLCVDMKWLRIELGCKVDHAIAVYVDRH